MQNMIAHKIAIVEEPRILITQILANYFSSMIFCKSASENW
jgi:hypothetical protein